MQITRPLALAAVLAGTFGATAAHAVEAGDWLARVGASHVSPNVSSGTTPNVAGGEVDVDSDTRISFTIGYMLTDNIGVEVLGALPFEHDIVGAGSLAGAGKVASARQLPPVVSALYYFQPTATVRPYVGLGINYTRFFDVEETGVLAGDKLHLSDSWGLAAQVGVDFDVSDDWFANASIRYADINTDADSATTGAFEVEIDPTVISVGIGRAF